jgi:hypothetical protein
MIKQPAILIAILTALFWGSCTNEQLTPDCNTQNMSYSRNVVPILKSYCYSCHSKGNSVGSNGILLDSYDSLKHYTKNDTSLMISILVGVISHDPRFVAMPYMKPKLDSCNINQITFWVFQGALDN